MSYNVSDLEKQQANRALIAFNSSLKLLDKSNEYLNIMKTPFKDNSDISPEDIMNARAAERRFRDKAIDNFNQFKTVAFKCVNIMQIFSSDTQTIKLMKSFISSIEDLETKVNKFSDLFNNLQSKEFPKDIVSTIEDIQKQCQEVDEIIDERIKNHLQNNILAKSWVDTVGDDLQMKIQKTTPLILELENEQKDQLNDKIKERSAVGN